MPVIHGPSGSPSAPQQYNQPSRKGKKAWRKHVDVSAVQDGLERLNEEIIKGGILAEKQSQELFVLDTKGDEAVAKRLPKKFKTLKADDIIAQRSAVPSVSARKRPGDKTTDGILPAKRQRTNHVTHKELVRLRKVADGHHVSTVDVQDATFDVWDAPQPQKLITAGDENESASFLPKKRAKRVPNTLKESPITLSANGKPVPAVSKPTSGFSYNPSFPDYEQRLAEEGMRAVETERQRLQDMALEQEKSEAAARSAAEAEAAEARAELSEWDEDSAWEGFESGVEEEGRQSTKKRPERKTQAQRNRIKRRKEEERRAKHEAAMRAKKAQAERIKTIAKDVAESERALALEREEFSDASSEGNENELRRRQLGKFRLPEKDLELVLPDELQDSLRRLKPEGNLLKDRYRSFLVRGKMESRRRITFRKQAKTKLTEKWTHKDFHLW